MDKREAGLFNKFNVERTDGKSAPGQKHEDCEYFVLDIDHDPHAMPALKAYADSCEAAYPNLAKDLRAKLPSPAPVPAMPPLLTRFDELDDAEHPCNKWWNEHGQYMMAGGGRVQFIWACRGWIAHEQFAAGVEVTGESMREQKPTTQGTPEGMESK